jgi:hypothetical protein
VPRFLFLALVLLTAGVALGQAPVTVTNLGYDPCADPDQVQVLAVNEGAASGNTELVPVFGSTRLWICSARLQGGAAGTLYAIFGSGAACADNADYLTVHLLTAANVPTMVLEAAGGNATFKRSEPARAFCIYRSVSMTLVGHVRYVQAVQN